jgi:hypothetical protein
MNQFLDKIRAVRETLNTADIVENIAHNVMQDLIDAGFEPELIKTNPKKTHTWRIMPKRELPEEAMEEFNDIKQQRTVYNVEQEKQRLRQLKSAMLK